MRYDVELRDDSARAAGSELQLFRDDEFIRGAPVRDTRAAIAEANAVRIALEADGWKG